MTDGDPRVVLDRFALGPQWPAFDPFLFVAHHRDAYPQGDEQLGPAASLQGRHLGMDFDLIDGWNMYHGSVVPGFPQHPHRGFETITYVRRGLIDHSDSMGATARFGQGDTQWMTAGAGVVHAEMFPLVNPNEPNPLELFQIWLNLAQGDKMVEPYFTMNWAEQRATANRDEANGEAEVATIVGAASLSIGDETIELEAPETPPNSWAARPEAQVMISHVRLSGEAQIVIAPASGPEVNRTIYVFDGGGLKVGASQGQQIVEGGVGATVKAERPLVVQASGSAPVECLIMQGKPIGEPVAQYGPFVMNSRAEVAAAFDDYQRTGFGGWPWPRPDPVHDREAGRFARHADGTIEQR